MFGLAMKLLFLQELRLVMSDGHPLLPEDSQQLRDPEEQDPALFEPGLCDGSGRGHRAGVPDAAARRDRLAGHSAQRLAQLLAEV